MEGVQGRIVEIIATIVKIPLGSFGPEDDLIVKFGVDSMQRIEVLIEMEKVFGITIPDEEANTLRTLSDFVGLVEKHKKVTK